MITDPLLLRLLDAAWRACAEPISPEEIELRRAAVRVARQSSVAQERAAVCAAEEKD